MIQNNLLHLKIFNLFRVTSLFCHNIHRFWRLWQFKGLIFTLSQRIYLGVGWGWGEGWKAFRWHFLDSNSTYICWKLTMCPPGHHSGPTMSINSFDLQQLRSGAGIWLQHTSSDVSVVLSTSDGSVLLPKAAWSESGKARCKTLIVWLQHTRV